MKLIKNSLFITVAGVAVLVATGTQAAQTNLVQTLRIKLNAHLQGPSITEGTLVSYSIVPQRIENRDVIKTIGDFLSTSFSLEAKLLRITPLPIGEPVIVVQDGPQRVDVSALFTHEKDDVRVAKGMRNLATGTEKGTEYAIHKFRLDEDLGLDFRVRGYTQAKYRSLTLPDGAVIGEAEEFLAFVDGTAVLNGEEAVVRGSISCLGRFVEVRD